MGFNRDTFVPNPAVCTHASPKVQEFYKLRFAFIGKIMGAGMRTSNPVGLDLAPLIWKRFLGEDVTVRDLAGIDERWVRAWQLLKLLPQKDSWNALGMSAWAAQVGCSAALSCTPISPGGGGGGASSPGGGEVEWMGGGGGGMSLVWTVRSASGRLVSLVPGGATRALQYEEREAFVALALKYRLTEFDSALEAMRYGLGQNVPLLMLPLLTYRELMVRVCGEVSVDLDVLKGIIKNKLDSGQFSKRACLTVAASLLVVPQELC